MNIATAKTTSQYALSFHCCNNKRCLAWIRLKAEAPWVESETLSDGTIVAVGAVINSLQYGGNLYKKLKRCCIICKKRRHR